MRGSTGRPGRPLTYPQLGAGGLTQQQGSKLADQGGLTHTTPDGILPFYTLFHHQTILIG